jgi:hypothetical protein
MNGDKLDLRDGKNIVSYVAGIGVEILLTAFIACIAVTVVLACGLILR